MHAYNLKSISALKEGSGGQDYPKTGNWLTQNNCSAINALVNFMPHPPHPRGGWGNTGDLTNRGVKFPTTGAKSAVKSPLCPHPHSRGFDNTSRMTKRIFHACD